MKRRIQGVSLLAILLWAFICTYSPTLSKAEKEKHVNACVWRKLDIIADKSGSKSKLAQPQPKKVFVSGACGSVGKSFVVHILFSDRKDDWNPNKQSFDPRITPSMSSAGLMVTGNDGPKWNYVSLYAEDTVAKCANKTSGILEKDQAHWKCFAAATSQVDTLTYTHLLTYM
jgi:hypothetical protein